MRTQSSRSWIRLYSKCWPSTATTAARTSVTSAVSSSPSQRTKTKNLSEGAKIKMAREILELTSKIVGVINGQIKCPRCSDIDHTSTSTTFTLLKLKSKPLATGRMMEKGTETSAASSKSLHSELPKTARRFRSTTSTKCLKVKKSEIGSKRTASAQIKAQSKESIVYATMASLTQS